MRTMKAIGASIVPVPQKVEAGEGQPLKLTSSSKFCLTAPEAEKGPVKTAVDNIKTFLTAKCGADCFAPEGIPVTLSLGAAPEGVKNEKEAYSISVSAEGITIEGYGASGLFYGVGSFLQLCIWDSTGAEIPAVKILDWPDNPFRAYKEECRYGSNMMEKEDWFALIDDLSSKKINNLSLALYGCWVMQYDGRVAEYLYLPIDGYPQLKTPMTVKYYSPTEGKWWNYEQLPPMYRDNFFGEVCRYAKDHGMDVIPGINSFGHNTLFPRLLPQIAPRVNGVPQPTGLCTSSEETYEFLFKVYDQIIDNYLLPNEMYSFNILLDEVWEQYGVDTEHPEIKYSPWCQCEKCQGKERSELFIEHSIKVMKYMKKKGIKNVVIAGDMLIRKVSKLGDLSAPFLKRIEEEDLKDVLLLDWWRYSDLKETYDFVIEPDELGLRSFFCPWNGYYIWNLLQHPMRNNQIMAQMNHNAKCGEGIYQYAMWDLSYDRIHDCFADYGWNFLGAGSLEDVTERYVNRHFAPMAAKVKHAYKLMELCTEPRTPIKNEEHPVQSVVSNGNMMDHVLSYYFYCYYRNPNHGAYPRHFPGEGLKTILAQREAYERAIYSVAAMAQEAAAIFEEAAKTPGCDIPMARRMAYECRNYQVLTQDWLAFLEIYDLTQKGDQKAIAPIARARQNARLSLMTLCEQVKEDWVCKAATMRNHAVFMQIFADIAAYIEATDEPRLDLFDIRPIMSKENRMLR